MKEALYKIPVTDAFRSGDECPFCYIEREIEQKSIDFVVGTDSYMQSDIREDTDKAGFCGYHLKKMYEYGNAQGNGLILNTHYKLLLKEFEKLLDGYTPSKAGFMEKLPIGHKDNMFDNDYTPVDPIAIWTAKKDASCYMCDYFNKSYSRYFDTFFYLYKKEPEFKNLIKESKGFCLHHFGQIMEAARLALSEKDHKEFTAMIFPLMKDNLARIQEDVSWFCDKFDYRYKDADWKTSRDALPRAIEKLRGGHPADPPYKKDK